MVNELIIEHRKAKAFADAIAENINAWDLEPLTNNCIGLVAHMRSHIKKEEDIVFPALENLSDPDREMTIFEKSQIFIKENFGEDYPQRMEAFANQLQEQVWGKGVIKYR